MSFHFFNYSRNNNLLNVIDCLFSNHDDNKLLSKLHQTTTGCALKKTTNHEWVYGSHDLETKEAEWPIIVFLTLCCACLQKLELPEFLSLFSL